MKDHLFTQVNYLMLYGDVVAAYFIHIDLCFLIINDYIYILSEVKSLAQSCLTLCDPMGCSIPLFTGFSRQGYWSGLPFPFPGNLPNPGIETGSPTLQADALPSKPPGKPYIYILVP